MKEALLSLKHIHKSYSGQAVLKDVSLDVWPGEFVTLLGPSGCGKTTLLRVIAGFEPIDHGNIYLSGKEISSLPPEARRVNTVFQNYALFPHLNIYDNIAYGPRVQKMPKAEIKVKADECLALVKMTGYEKRMPHQISGGQRQRIAIARALINAPDILLLDEPLGALDLKLRQHMEVELKRIQKATGTAFVYVTHDQEEALYLSDKIAVMDAGALGFCQIGSPGDIYRRPTSLFSAQFVGERNILPVTPVQSERGRTLVEFSGNRLWVQGMASVPCYLAVLQDSLMVSRGGSGIEARVTDFYTVGSQSRVECALGDLTLKAIIYNHPESYIPGDRVRIVIPEQASVLIGGGEV